MGVAWPSDRIERRAVSSLKEYARNTRTHSAEQVDALAESIRQWGWTTPVLIDDGGRIIAGHGRVMAAKRLGIVEVPVMIAHGWSEEQKRAYVIADNKLYERGGWDFETLAAEVCDLAELGADIASLGLSDKEMGDILGSEEAEVKESDVGTSTVLDEFWISVSGPLCHQAEALSRLVQVMESIPGVHVELGTVKRDGLG